MAVAMRTPTISTSWPQERTKYLILFVYGTSGGDGIEGAGREGQIIYGGAGHDTINGTGNSDIHNDTSNGDGGNDTIYGVGKRYNQRQ